ncbi:hypothetical protein BDQ94DRAFT_147118 [Aspergillus welwitschiae]|uniref:Uncharacterized protein n=1 Tax=Aspergillus welwitschiae TaxID=1341132 RepID=A0A3F3PZ37_9EURO|nr:hypothetical protein BDQ94DRAFT_147118 [Aspergillus welwitschiae]RDH31636.1 hypothetical protein BDQ94DRAFT_147118 [Aspergillus welwitschiae]
MHFHLESWRALHLTLIFYRSISTCLPEFHYLLVQWKRRKKPIPVQLRACETCSQRDS